MGSPLDRPRSSRIDIWADGMNTEADQNGIGDD